MGGCESHMSKQKRMNQADSNVRKLGKQVIYPNPEQVNRLRNSVQVQNFPQINTEKPVPSKLFDNHESEDLQAKEQAVNKGQNLLQGADSYKRVTPMIFQIKLRPNQPKNTEKPYEKRSFSMNQLPVSIKRQVKTENVQKSQPMLTQSKDVKNGPKEMEQKLPNFQSLLRKVKVCKEQQLNNFQQNEYKGKLVKAKSEVITTQYQRLQPSKNNIEQQSKKQSNMMIKEAKQVKLKESIPKSLLNTA